MIGRGLRYWMSEHPAVVTFRWSDGRLWAASWPFLLTSIAAYFLLSLSLPALLSLLLPRIRRPPSPSPSLSPLPCLHSLVLAVASATIFAGTLLSTVAEIRETGWIWRRSKTPLQWLLCFPLGTRSSGRVFFWSYAFYLSRFLHMGRTILLAVLRCRPPTVAHLWNHTILVLVAFVWLDFSQSVQVPVILATAAVNSVGYGYRCWTEAGLRRAGFPVVANCRVVVVCVNMVCNLGVMVLHLTRGDCHGIGAWEFNLVLNGAIVFLFLNSHSWKRMRTHSGCHDDDGGEDITCGQKKM